MPRKGRNAWSRAAAKLVVCESQGIWSAAIRSLGSLEGIELVEARSWEECREELKLAPQATLAFEFLGAGSAVWLTEAARLSVHFPRVCVVGLNAPQEGLIPVVKSVEGFVATLRSVLDAPQLVEIARRQNRRFPGAARSIRERLWAKLPGA